MLSVPSSPCGVLELRLKLSGLVVAEIGGVRMRKKRERDLGTNAP